MSNDEKILKLFTELLPNMDTFSNPEDDLMEFFDAICKEFVRFLDYIDALALSLPDSKEGILSDRWQKIFGTSNLEAKSKEFGLVFNERRTCPGEEFFKNLGKVFNVKFDISSDEKKLLFLSHERIPQDLEDIILKVSPAHKEVKFAQN